MVSRRVTLLTCLGAGAFLAAGATPSTGGAQESEVRAAVETTLDAWSAGDFDILASFYHPDAKGFFLDGGFLVEGVDVNALRVGYETGVRADLSLRDLRVRLLGDAAVSTAYLDGALTLPAGVQIPGTWRYTETRVRDGATWKIIQYHFSTLTAEAPR